VSAVSSDAYMRAFAKRLGGFNGAEAELEPDERKAILAVGRAMGERAMGKDEGKYGQYALPLVIDPTVILTNEGAINPLRELASVSTVNTFEWHGVSSAGPTAAFAKEGTEVGDGTFELAQVAIKPEKAHAFIPATIEVTEDWAGFVAEMGRLLADAKEVVEATKMTVGSGTNEPAGIVTGSTEEVETSEAGKVKFADIYSIQGKLSPRFQPRASWLSTLAVANSVYGLVGGGSTEPPLFNPERTRLLLKPWYELSTMDGKIETGKRSLSTAILPMVSRLLTGSECRSKSSPTCSEPKNGLSERAGSMRSGGSVRKSRTKPHSERSKSNNSESPG
jgi:HK97 family phage major capsid protein